MYENTRKIGGLSKFVLRIFLTNVNIICKLRLKSKKILKKVTCNKKEKILRKEKNKKCKKNNLNQYKIGCLLKIF